MHIYTAHYDTQAQEMKYIQKRHHKHIRTLKHTAISKIFYYFRKKYFQEEIGKGQFVFSLAEDKNKETGIK